MANLPFTLFVTSDVHLETMDDVDAETASLSVPRIVREMPPAEVCVLAGDIGDPTHPHFSEFLHACASKYALVLFVPGNHEYWYAPDKMIERVCVESGVVYLNNRVHEHKGVRFLGTTLWTDVGDDDRHEAYTIRDFTRIPCFTFEAWQRKHAVAKAFLVTELLKGEGISTIVVTHHAPSFKCIPPSYANDPTSVFYATNLHGFTTSKAHAPVMWISGHTHWPLCELVKHTLLFSNPRLDAAHKPVPTWTDAQTFGASHSSP